MRVAFGRALGACVVTVGLLAAGVGAHARSATAVAAGDAACSKAAATAAGRPDDPFSPAPIRLALCGAFLGPGSKAMVVTFLAQTCFPIQAWAVYGLEDGAWRLVKVIPAYLEPPLVAVGDQIRETTAVYRSGDSRCNPTGGAHARL